MKQSKTVLKQLINSFDRSHQLYLEYYLSNMEMENELVMEARTSKTRRTVAKESDYNVS